MRLCKDAGIFVAIASNPKEAHTHTHTHPRETSLHRLHDGLVSISHTVV